MKKFIAMLLAVMMLFAFAGCKNKQEESEPIAENEEAVKETAEAESKTMTVEGYKGTVTFKSDAYKTLSVDVSGNYYEVTDEDVEAELDYCVDLLTTTNLITDRPVELGDTALIDYVGSVDGVEFEGGSSTDRELKIGSGAFIDDFEEQLIGAKAGDEVKVEVTFPAEYHTADLAGKDAIFMVTVKGITEYFVPEMNDETAKELGYENLEAARAEARATLEAEMEEQRNSDIQNELWLQVEEIVEVVVDDEDKQALVEKKKKEYEEMAAANGMDLMTMLGYYGMLMSDFELYCEETSIEEIKYYMTVRALADIYDIEITDDAFSKACDELAVLMGYESGADFKKKTSVTMEEYYSRKAIENYYFSNNVLETLQKNSTVVG